jgi:soluble lytic murein transglycosylase-like protein
MTYVEEKRRARRRKKLKKMIIRFCVYSVLAGMILGFFIGRVSVYGEEVPEVKVVEAAIEETEDVEEVKYYDCPLSEELQDYIRTLCKEKDVPMDLVIAQIQVESNFRADCVSDTNDYGLMQINKINHGWLKEKYGITDFLDPYQNVLCGINILSGHLRNCGNLEKALMSYNMGTVGADNLWKQGIRTTKYVQKIKSVMADVEKVIVEIEEIQ